MGWHDCVSIRAFDNVSGSVINKAFCIATDNGGGGQPWHLCKLRRCIR